MSDFECYFVIAWCVAAVVLAVLSWFVAKTTVRVEKNKGVLSVEQAEKRVRQNERSRRIAGYIGFAVIVLRLLVTLFASRGFNDYVDLIYVPILAIVIALLVRYWSFVYYYSKELAEFRAKQ